STIASTTSAALTQSPRAWTTLMRAPLADASAASSLPFAASRCSACVIAARAFSAHPILVSNSRTGCPACAAICAMPAPIAPAPMTATIASRGRAAAVVISAPDESRRAFFEKRRDAFAVVGAIAEHPLRVAFKVELLLERVVGGRVERPLDRHDAG